MFWQLNENCKSEEKMATIYTHEDVNIDFDDK